MAYRRTRARRALETMIVLGLVGSLTAGCAILPGRGPRAQARAPDTGPMIGVNAFLWRAALDTLAFMPLVSADAYGGVINYDWYTNPEQPNERFKATVYILDTRLRADGLNVAINRQVRSGNDWVEAPTAPDTEDQIENSILNRARQIRVSGR